MAPGANRRRRIVRAVAVTSACVLAAAAVTLLVARPWSGRSSPADVGQGITRALDRRLPDEAPRVRFREEAAALGLVMQHGSGPRSSLLPEDMGSGAALEDFDGDGDLDLFVVNFAGPIGRGSSSTAQPPADGATHRLFRNDGGRFADVTAASGAGFADYGIGVAAGDADGDGLIDLYVTGYGRNRMLRNLGGLRFEDVTARSGTGADGFGSGAVFGDPDRDGDLDLYVCNYLKFRWNGEAQEASAWGAYSVPYTLNPSSFAPARNLFFRNLGDGTFREEAQALHIDDPDGRSLSATFADFSGDGWPDLYVLNDVSRSAYFENRGDGSFADRTQDSLAADYRGAMGNAVGDFDGDGDLDLFITHWIAQENALFQNLSSEQAQEGDAGDPVTFTDAADLYGVGQVALDYVGWGTAFADYDFDGAPDLVLVNGSTMEQESDRSRLQPQRPLLFWQKRGLGFFETCAVAGAPWQERWNARGLCCGDVDGDGDLDFVVTGNREPLRLLVNEGTPHHWLRVRLRQPAGNRFAVGAWVTVTCGKRRLLQEVGAGTSYLCHHPYELTFGLGTAAVADRVEVRWPDGRRTAVENAAADRVLVLTPDGGSSDAPR